MKISIFFDCRFNTVYALLKLSFGYVIFTLSHYKIYINIEYIENPVLNSVCYHHCLRNFKTAFRIMALYFVVGFSLVFKQGVNTVGTQWLELKSHIFFYSQSVTIFPLYNGKLGKLILDLSSPISRSFWSLKIIFFLLLNTRNVSSVYTI